MDEDTIIETLVDLAEKTTCTVDGPFVKFDIPRTVTGPGNMTVPTRQFVGGLIGFRRLAVPEVVVKRFELKPGATCTDAAFAISALL